MALPLPPRPSQPIPNNPFYYPEGNYIRGEYGPFIVGGGIFIDYATGTISAGGTGPGGVNTILAGNGISVSPNTGGVVTVTNTGALSITAGNGIQIVNNGGNYTIINSLPASAPTGTVTSITAGPGLSGGTITTSGTISLTPSGVGPGTYVNPVITVDAYGRVTYAAPSGGGGSGGAVLAALPLRSNGLVPSTISIDSASTSTPGAVQLDDSTTSTSTTKAATARALNEVYNLANTASSGVNTAVNSANTALTTANNACLIAQTAQTCALLALTNASIAQGDATQALINAAAAQSTANTALTNASAAQTTANTALASASARIPCSAFLAKGDILVGTGAGTYVSLAPGTDGQVLVACAACGSGLTWTTSAASGGTVTSITAGTGLSGGTITTSGTINLANTAVVPGSYTYSSITVDAQGRLTAASSGVAPVTTVTGTAPISVTTGVTPDVSIAAASTTSPGAVQLYNALDSTSTTLALTAAQGKALQDQITALSVSSNITLAGTLNAATGLIDSVTASGSAAGFAVGSPLPAAAVGNAEFFVIADVAASSYTPPGGAPTVVHVGDWFLSDGTTWQFLDVAYQAPYASTTAAGTVELATNAETQAGTDSTVAVTPASLQSKLSDSTSLTSSTTIASSTAVRSAYNLAAAAIPCSLLTAKGNIIAASASGTPVALPVGTSGQVLSASPGSPSGLQWVTPGTGTVTLITTGTGLAGGPISTVGNICLANTSVTPGSYTSANITVDAQGRITAASNGSAGTGSVTSVIAGTGLTGGTITTSGTIALNPACVIAPSVLTAKGSIISATAASTPTALGVGTNGQVLTACSACTSGLTWAAIPVPADIPCSIIVAKGNIVAGTAASTPGVVGVGTNGQVLTACSTCATGLTWVTPSGAADIPCACITGKGSLITGTAASTPVALPVGTDGQFLAACSTATSGLCWVSASLGPATPTVFGTVYGCTGLNTEQITYLGRNAGASTQRSNNIAIGDAAMELATGSAGNIAIGNGTMRCATSGPQLAIGHAALCKNDGFGNTVVAYLGGMLATTVCHATALGYAAMIGVTTGGSNTAIGSEAGRELSSGFGNTMVGRLAGCALTTGCNNIMVGSFAGCTFTTGCNNVIIGSSAQAASPSANNTITLGNASITTLRAAVTTITSLSDERDKTDIIALPVGLDFINALNPVKFTWQQREPNEVKDGTAEAGFIAQELQAAEAEHNADYLGLVYDENPEKLEASPGKLIPVLVKAIQELSAKNDALGARIAHLEANG